MWITESGLFEGVSQQTINKIAGKSVVGSYEQGSVIFKAGEEAEFFYILVEGAVDVSARQGIDFTVNRPGAIIGLSALIEPFRYNTQAFAKTSIEVVKVPREAFEHVLKVYPEDGVLILKHLITVMGQRLKDAYEYIIT